MSMLADSHLVSTNALFRFTPSSTHQPRSWSKAEAPLNIAYIVVTPEVSHAPMSSLKDHCDENKFAMSVTPDVSQVEMWPYVALADALSESHAATAVRMVVSSAIRGLTVGANVTVGLRVVGAGVGAQPPATCVTPHGLHWISEPHDVDAHLGPANAAF